MVCKDTSKMYLNVLNGLISLMGLGIVGVGVYGVVALKEELAAINKYAQWLPLALGAIVFLTGVLGCLGARWQNKCALLMYWVVMTIVTLAVLALGVVFLLQVGYLDDVKLGNSADLVDQGQAQINDFTLAVFSECCGATVPNCADAAVGEACVQDRDSFDSFAIPTEVCDGLKEVSIENTTVVPGGCVSATVFKSLFTEYVSENVMPIGISLIVLSVLLLLADIFTCCLICSNRIDYDQEYRDRVQQQQAGAISGTTQQGVKYV